MPKALYIVITIRIGESGCQVRSWSLQLGYLVPNWRANVKIWLKPVWKLLVLWEILGMLSIKLDNVDSIALSIKKLAQNHFDCGLSYDQCFDDKFDTLQSNCQDCQPHCLI